MKLQSVYDSLEYESRKSLRKYGKQLRKINELGSYYRSLTTERLKAEFERYMSKIGSFDIHNKKHVQHIFAIAREVTFR